MSLSTVPATNAAVASMRARKRKPSFDLKEARRAARERRDAARTRLLQMLAQNPSDDCVLTYVEWFTLNTISRDTADDLCAKGKGPRFTYLSEGRRGVTVAENRRWQQSRTRG